VVTSIAALPGWSYGTAEGNGELWVSNVDNGLVYRITHASG
jgi:hypothetical protein